MCKIRLRQCKTERHHDRNIYIYIYKLYNVRRKEKEYTGIHSSRRYATKSMLPKYKVTEALLNKSFHLGSLLFQHEIRSLLTSVMLNSLVPSELRYNLNCTNKTTTSDFRFSLSLSLSPSHSLFVTFLLCACLCVCARTHPGVCVCVVCEKFNIMTIQLFLRF